MKLSKSIFIRRLASTAACVLPILAAITLSQLELCCSVVAAEEFDIITHYQHDNLERWVINRPSVKRHLTEYRQIKFKPGDAIIIHASGGVQTGGYGLTWKLYVDPRGPNSGSLYHGLVSIPGAVVDGKTTHVGTELVRIKELNNYTLTISPNTSVAVDNMFLRLGYEDDDYDDNGYWGHDDGTGDQTKGVGPAVVEIEVRHGVVTDPPVISSLKAGDCIITEFIVKPVNDINKHLQVTIGTANQLPYPLKDIRILLCKNGVPAQVWGISYSGHVTTDTQSRVHFLDKMPPPGQSNHYYVVLTSDWAHTFPPKNTILDHQMKTFRSPTQTSKTPTTKKGTLYVYYNFTWGSIHTSTSDMIKTITVHFHGDLSSAPISGNTGKMTFDLTKTYMLDYPVSPTWMGVFEMITDLMPGTWEVSGQYTGGFGGLSLYPNPIFCTGIVMAGSTGSVSFDHDNQKCQ